MTDTARTDRQRLDALEIRIAHQDATIEELNHTVTEQWKLIDRLAREVRSLSERAEAAELETRRAPGEEPPPPHW